MKPLALLLAMSALVFGDPGATLKAGKARTDFALSADPASPNWRGVPVVAASVDPMGKATSNSFDFQVQWTADNLYFLFTCPYDALTLKANPVTKEETNKLWDWDVAEIFIGSDFANIHRYREYQVSPQGEWVDLDIDRKTPRPEGGWKWNSGFEVKARIDAAKKIWYGEMRIPVKSIDEGPAVAGKRYRVNFYRLAGADPKRQSIMWTPVHNRSHHTPDQFGTLTLSK